MPQDKLLRYEIDSWDELPGCLSNSSKHLHLTYDDVIDKPLTGGVVRVEHDRYGCLFAYVVNASGTLLTAKQDGIMYELTPYQILSELRKYGFIIKFSKAVVLDDDQFNLLVTANELHMDKIRIMYVSYRNKFGAVEESKAYLVCFNIEHLPTWLNNSKVCNEAEFSKAVSNGYAVNLTHAKGGLTSPHNWSFLIDKILNIDDLLCVAGQAMQAW